MSKQPTKAALDKSFAEVEKVGLVVETVPRTVYDRFVWIMGEKFDADDLEETLSEVQAGPIYTHMTDARMVRAMTAIGVISGSSPSWGTSIPENGGKERLEKFLTMLHKALDADPGQQ